MEKYSQHSVISGVNTGVYLFIILMVYLLYYWGSIFELAAYLLILVLLFYLVRSLSVSYKITDDWLKVSRLFGSRRVTIESVSKVEKSSLRDLAPVSWTGGWGWRSRMWSPVIGHFDNLSTVHLGLIVYAEGVPLFISPKDRDAFVRELELRCGNRLSTKSDSA
jgi:hypothetical protein